jgi:exonuclease III/ribonuclease HI
MPKSVRILQINAARRAGVQLSILNDRSVQDFDVIMVTEPRIMDFDNQPVVHQHQHWNTVRPTLIREDSVIHSFRSLMYVNKKTQFQQVPVPSSDIVAGLLKTNMQKILLMSVYIPWNSHRTKEENDAALVQRLQAATTAWETAKEKWGADTQLLVGGDFNRHDQLWGGDSVAHSQRQGEGTPILEWMCDHGVRSMLPRGTKTFQAGPTESTIDLVLASGGLTERFLKCHIHEVDHGSDHRAIVSIFNDQKAQEDELPNINFRKTDWDAVRSDLMEQNNHTTTIRTAEELEAQTELIIPRVRDAIARHSPKKKPSPYMKAWWDEELSMLRYEYTVLRNRHTNQIRSGDFQPQLEAEVKTARRRFHHAIRDKKKRHWQAFLEEPDNVWKAARYLKSAETTFGHIPTLVDNGNEVEDEKEKAAVLLKTFFPPTPPGRSDSASDQLDATLIQENPQLTLEEVGYAVRQVKPWKAPGVDGLPSAAWKEVWPVLQEWILAIFNASVRIGIVPRLFKTARILPLRKPGKPDYTVPKAYRPISLLPTLGKILELVVARRLSYWAETYGLLPKNQFGARPLRSCEQALILLTTKIKEAWKRGKILTLVSFDVKGAYNGVPREVLADRLLRKGIPTNVVQWVRSFCSERKATMVVNGFETEASHITYPGLPQGSPLSPILYIFFNADLVEEGIDDKKGAIGFVDDYTRWTVGDTVEENLETIQNVVVPRVLDWASRSGATFEGDKTSLIHFVPAGRQKKIPRPMQALRIEGALVGPSDSVKILGVVLDSGLNFKEHVARAAKRGWHCASTLPRLRGVRPSTARQLYETIVTSRIDYAAAVWFARFVGRNMPQWMQRLLTPIEHFAAKTIIGCFKSVSREVARAEASIQPADVRLSRRTAQLWAQAHTLPKISPIGEILDRQATNIGTSHRTPFSHMALALPRPPRDMETIEAFAVAPWQQPPERWVYLTRDGEEAAKRCITAQGTELQVFTSAAAKNGKVGYSAVAWMDNEAKAQIRYTLGTDNKMDRSVASLAAIMEAVEGTEIALNAIVRLRKATIYSDDASALQAISNPRRQSGQSLIRRIIRALWKNNSTGKDIRLSWIPRRFDIPGAKEAAKLARATTTTESQVTARPWVNGSSKSAVRRSLRNALITASHAKEWTTGRHLKTIDTALPGKHVRLLYDTLSRAEAQTLAQLRTGHSRLRRFLTTIGAMADNQCVCGQGKEDTRHFLIHCRRYQHLRGDMIKECKERYGDLSYMLGGRSSYKKPDGSDLDGPRDKWKPNVAAVRATIKFAMKTGRLNPQPLSSPSST